MDWDREKNQFTAEASTVRFDWAGPLWMDSDERGVFLISHRTGRIQPFKLVHRQIDAERETRWWKFVNQDIGCSLMLFND
jgi:hypothetical protein